MKLILLALKMLQKSTDRIIIGLSSFYNNTPPTIIDNHEIRGVLHNQELIGWNYFGRGVSLKTFVNVWMNIIRRVSHKRWHSQVTDGQRK